MKKSNKEKNNNDKINKKTIGEEICTEFKWVSLDSQKEIVDRLDKITKNKKTQKNNR